jgi:ubiquinone/menaquinone biosynthesis C-methylase UbiE
MGDEPRRVVQRGYDDVAESYLADRTVDGGDVVMLRGLLSRLAPGSRVLDAGCGAGVPVMKLVTDAEHRAVGLDFSARQLSLARSRVPGADLVRGDLSTLPFPHQHFDAIVSFYAIIHVPRRDHLAILRECHRVLRPGGLALLCLGANDVAEDHDPTSWLGTAMYWSHYDAATNLELLRDTHLDVITDRLVPDPMGHSGHLFALAIRR